MMSRRAARRQQARLSKERDARVDAAADGDEYETGHDIEKIMWTGVEDCPNNGNGPCGFVHTCVTWNRDGTVAGPPGTRSVLVGRVSTVPDPDGVTA